MPARTKRGGAAGRAVGAGGPPDGVVTGAPPSGVYGQLVDVLRRPRTGAVLVAPRRDP
ncbi:hypothetical protein [Streptomyces griseoviridis]|uniref:Uncharacterized protein n=1 Tax=Streptomyces griseoviridis TaxID=45398 RepID=A0ABT9LCH8_STRGD|nr:hypothetical protein [Streptomyces griseoviridis]MDP9681428.1 hypothetical protein [Streptomyces griseoviridis]GGS74670.1 hypothetical protein GCM10010240_04660 [Streptomyces griseoviridis]